jgi:hypothetical protein
VDVLEGSPHLVGVREPLRRRAAEAAIDDEGERRRGLGVLGRSGGGGAVRIACMRDARLRAALAASGLEVGQRVKVTLALDEEERTVETPEDFSSALRRDKKAAAAWEKLSFSHKREHVEAIVGAKKPETRARRIAKALEMLRGG